MIDVLFICLFAILGLYLSYYLWVKKQQDTEFNCPLKGKCHDVVHSQYSKFFGIPIELTGMIYYSVILIGYSLTYTRTSLITTDVLFLISTAAVSFSVYLTIIQIFVLRKLCTWCLVSALFSMVIFILAMRVSGII
jgi:uncharacterized membrane protein